MPSPFTFYIIGSALVSMSFGIDGGFTDFLGIAGTLTICGAIVRGMDI